MRLLLLSSLIVSAGLCQAEIRRWTSADGRVIEAELVRGQGTAVVLKLKDGREVTVELAKLSVADQQFAATQPQAAVTGKARPSFGEGVVDKRTWKMRPQADTMGITTVAITQQFETPHFLITCGPKIKQPVIDVYAEVCERCYEHVLRDFPSAESEFKDRRILIMLSPDEAEHVKTGEAIAKLGEERESWAHISIASGRLPKAVADSKKLMTLMRGFNVDAEGSSQRNPLWPARIHFVTSTLLDACNTPGSDGKYSLILWKLSYCYFTEYEATGKIVTKVVFGGNPSVVEGFKNSRGWPEAVKRILNTTPIRPGLERFLKNEGSDAEPIDLGGGFGMMQWIFGDPVKRAALDHLLEESRKSRNPPKPVEFAKALGAPSVEAFDEQWIAFLKSAQFK